MREQLEKGSRGGPCQLKIVGAEMLKRAKFK